MIRITIRKPKKKDDDFTILKNGRKFDTEGSKLRANQAAKFYRHYFSIPTRKRKEWVQKAKRSLK